MKNTIDSEAKPVALLGLGIVLFIVSIGFSLLANTSTQEGFLVLNIVVKTIIAIIALKKAYDYSEKLHRKKYLWAFLGFVLGGLSLIILSFLSSNEK